VPPHTYLTAAIERFVRVRVPLPRNTRVQRSSPVVIAASHLNTTWHTCRALPHFFCYRLLRRRNACRAFLLRYAFYALHTLTFILRVAATYAIACHPRTLRVRLRFPSTSVPALLPDSTNVDHILAGRGNATIPVLFCRFAVCLSWFLTCVVPVHLPHFSRQRLPLLFFCLPANRTTHRITCACDRATNFCWYRGRCHYLRVIHVPHSLHGYEPFVLCVLRSGVPTPCF